MEMKGRKVRDARQGFEVQELIQMLIDVLRHPMHAIDIHISASERAHRTAPRALGFGLVADCLYIVPIRADHKGTEIIWVVDLADPGWAVIPASGSQSRCVEGHDLIAIFRRECKMHGPLDLFAGPKPKFRFAVFSKSSPSAEFGHQPDAEGRERAGVKLFALFVIADSQSDMIHDHGNSDAVFGLV